LALARRGGEEGFKMPLSYKHNLKLIGRKLRSNQTDAERLLWSKIRKKQMGNFQFNRQKPIGNYIVDFYCDKAKLVVEIDGGQHYEYQNILEDKKREEYLIKSGLKTIRFTNLEVLKNIENVVDKIYQEIKIHPHPPLKRRE
jgi:very-short-patch-repair endonuclease